MLFWSIWSKRVAIGCLAAWGVMVTIYIVLGAVGHALLPQPYNSLIMVTLSTTLIGSVTSWLAAQILAHLDNDALGIETRDGRLYYELARMRGEMAKILERLEKTDDLSRPALALVGEAYDTGYADGLAREPMAKVLQIGPRAGGS